MSYHNDVIQVLKENPYSLEAVLGIYGSVIRTEVGFGEGDVDLYVVGCDFEGNEKEFIIEVKGHVGLVEHYRRKQLPKYQRHFPDAQYWVIAGTSDKSLELDKFTYLSSTQL